jgi:hypothetical protein
MLSLYLTYAAWVHATDLVPGFRQSQRRVLMMTAKLPSVERACGKEGAFSGDRLVGSKISFKAYQVEQID